MSGTWCFVFLCVCLCLTADETTAPAAPTPLFPPFDSYVCLTYSNVRLYAATTFLPLDICQYGLDLRGPPSPTNHPTHAPTSEV